MQWSNDLGCVSCFCYGHSDVCTSTPGYSVYRIESIFNRDTERWSARDKHGNEVSLQYNSLGNNIGASSNYHDNSIYFYAPPKFLGDKKYAYNRNLSFSLQLSGGKGMVMSTME